MNIGRQTMSRREARVRWAREFVRVTSCPHIDAETFDRYLADLSMGGWDDIRYEVELVVKATEQADERAEQAEQQRDEAERERDRWQETAREMANGLEFYRDIVQQVGAYFGPEAYTSDDGSVQDSVFALKVPELAARERARAEALEVAIREYVSAKEALDTYCEDGPVPSGIIERYDAAERALEEKKCRDR